MAGKCAQKILVYACIIQVAVELFLLPICVFFQREKLLYLVFDKWHFVFRKKIPPAAINFIISLLTGFFLFIRRRESNSVQFL